MLLFLSRFPLTPPKKDPSLEKEKTHTHQTIGAREDLFVPASQTFNAWLSGQSIRLGDPSPSMLMFLAHPVDVLRPPMGQVPKVKPLQMGVCVRVEMGRPISP